MLTILEHPDPVLNSPTMDVLVVNKDINHIIDQMTETMYAAKGIGLAANQVGIPLKMAVIDVDWPKTGNRSTRVLINPIILAKEDLIDFEEGCLSIPGEHDTTRRYNRVTVRYKNRQGQEEYLAAEGLLAVAIQHEVDHLNGIIYLERLKE